MVRRREIAEGQEELIRRDALARDWPNVWPDLVSANVKAVAGNAKTYAWYISRDACRLNARYLLDRRLSLEYI